MLMSCVCAIKLRVINSKLNVIVLIDNIKYKKNDFKGYRVCSCELMCIEQRLDFALLINDIVLKSLCSSEE